MKAPRTRRPHHSSTFLLNSSSSSASVFLPVGSPKILPTSFDALALALGRLRSSLALPMIRIGACLYREGAVRCGGRDINPIERLGTTAVGRSFVEHVVHRHHFETRASCPSEEDPRRFLLTSQRGI